VLIDRADYWDHPAISNTQISEYAISPHHWHARFVEKRVPDESTVALRRGRATHAYVLERETFDERFPIFLGEKRTNAAKAEYDALDAAARRLDGCALRDTGTEAVDMDTLRGIDAGLRRNRFIAKLFAHITHAEIPIVWTCAETGVECKARIDAIAEISGALIVIDLKTMRDAPLKSAAEKAIANGDLHRQGAHYLAAVEAHFGRKADDYYLPFVESSAPYASALYPLDAESLAIGERSRIELLTDLAMRRESNRWDFQESIETIGLPDWKKRSAA
jgi:hypothetical protein